MKLNKAALRESAAVQRVLKLYKKIQWAAGRGRRRTVLCMSVQQAQAVLEAYHPCPVNTFEGYETWKPRTKELSVIIPAHNVAPYLRECLDSVLAQKTGISYEIIVVENGSSDETWEILQEYGGKPEILAVRDEIADVSRARNRAISMASGKYLFFLDADDFLRPGMIAKLLETQRRTEADIVVCGYENLEGGVYYPRKITEKERVCTSYREMCNVPGFTWGRLMKAELFCSVGFPEHFWYEDSIIFYAIYPQASKMALLPELGYVYRRNPKSITSTQTVDPRCLDTFWVMKEMTALAENFKVSDKAALYSNYLSHFTEISWLRVRALPKEIRQAFFCLAAELLDEARNSAGTELLATRLTEREKLIDRMFAQRREEAWEQLCRYGK